MLVDGGPATQKTFLRDLQSWSRPQGRGYEFPQLCHLDDSARHKHVVTISSPTTSDLVVTNPGVPGVELHIPAGTVIHDARGNLVTQIGITPIPTKQPPFPLKRGVTFPVYFTIQPGGASFTNAGSAITPALSSSSPSRKGAKIHYQNRYRAKKGAKFEFWNYDPAQKGWYVYGHGRVTDDEKMIVPDANTQIFSFDGAMVALPSDRPGIGPNGPNDGDPINLQTGLFVYTKTDLAVNDRNPDRLDPNLPSVGSCLTSLWVGTNLSYDMFLVGDTASPGGYTYQDLVFADGGRVHFTRTSPCTDGDGSCAYYNAVYTATSTPGPLYGATIAWVGGFFVGTWNLTTKDGTVYIFPDAEDASNWQEAALIGIIDRHGNAMTFTRDQHSNLTKITSPNGRWIQLTYDALNRVTSAVDNIGRSVSYGYSSEGYLLTATDANRGTTDFAYDGNGDMLSVQDPNGITYLQNEYDLNDMVTKQTLADGGIYKFAYSMDSNNNVTQTDVWDPQGYHRIVAFNSDGYMTNDTHAVGKPEVQAITYNRQEGTGFLLGITDALNRQTQFAYDSMGNVTTITQLAGTANAATTSFSYNPQYYEVASVSDPLGNTTSFSYDNLGSLVSVSNPLGETATFTYNSQGQPLTATDPQGNQSQFSYDAGDLTATTDPLGRTTSGFVDAAGRIISVTDPLGHSLQIAYDPLNQITSMTDPLGNQTSFTYDGNGNRLTVTDANQHTTTYTYDNMDRVHTRQDPLGHQSTALYDLNGNLTNFTDRKGQVAQYTYDGLNRPTLIKFNDSSTITNTFDAGGRLTGVSDSTSGTISRSYDGLNHLLSEMTPQGSVGYTYYGNGRRHTMTVSGQLPVNYAFNNAGRLTSIGQGSSNVSFVYDSDGRRTAMTLPNGISATYAYDAASQLAGIVYQGAAMAPADLEYGYDLAGRRISVGGSLASTQLPTAVSSATYNANNQLTQWGSTSMTYDLNGNTLNDGMNSYTWNARNRLVSANNGGAMFRV